MTDTAIFSRSALAAPSLAIILLLAACAGTPDDPLADSATDGSARDSLSGQGVGQRPDLDANRGDDPYAGRRPDAQPALGDVIYFDFDSSQIQPQFQAIVEGHARKLRAEPGSRLRLEGHTDERGTREYNIALGERRAESVRRALLLRGVARAQLSVVSYGEETPVMDASTESAWSQNRRVVFSYLR